MAGASEGAGARELRRRRDIAEGRHALNLIVRTGLPLPADIPLVKKAKAYLVEERADRAARRLQEERNVGDYFNVKEHLEKTGRWGLRTKQQDQQPRQQPRSSVLRAIRRHPRNSA